MLIFAFFSMRPGNAIYIGTVRLGLERIQKVTNTIRIATTGWQIRIYSRIHFFSEAKLGNGLSVLLF